MHPAHFFKIENRIIPNSDFKMDKHFCLCNHPANQDNKCEAFGLYFLYFPLQSALKLCRSAYLEDLKVERLRESVEIHLAGKASLLMMKRAPS